MAKGLIMRNVDCNYHRFCQFDDGVVVLAVDSLGGSWCEVYYKAKKYDIKVNFINVKSALVAAHDKFVAEHQYLFA